MFLPVIMDMLQIDKIYGIVLEENIASHKVLEKNGFKLVFKGIENIFLKGNLKLAGIRIC